MREGLGRTLTLVTIRESEGVSGPAARVAPGTKVYADEAVCWDELDALV